MTVLLGIPDFVVGLGDVGAVLLDIASSPCNAIEVDGKTRWSCGRKQITATVMQRMLDKDYVTIIKGAFAGRDVAELTSAGQTELMRYCLIRSVEMSQAEPPPQYAQNGDKIGAVHTVALNLAERVEDLRRAKAKATPFSSITVQTSHRGTGSLSNLLAACDAPGERYLLMLSVLREIATEVVGGVRFDEADVFANWCATMMRALLDQAIEQSMDGEPDEDSGAVAEA